MNEADKKEEGEEAKERIGQEVLREKESFDNLEYESLMYDKPEAAANNNGQESILQQQIEEFKAKLLSQRADFDNYKRRTEKEKENIYSKATSDMVLLFLPILDNINRAIDAVANLDSELLDGIKLVARQFDDIFKSIGIEEIAALDQAFDPSLHNAVAHIDSEDFGKNVIVQVLAKGYKLKDKVIRYAMVKVAN